MRISRKKPKNQVVQQKKHRTNNHIKVPQVRLIDDSGANIGVIDTDKALAMALDRGLDLVEVSPLAQPPVAKIVDYSKLKYQEEKERRKERAKIHKVDIKGIRLTFRIGEGDKAVRIKQAIKFLEADDKVKIEMNLRGRERQHRDLAKENIIKFIDKIKESIDIVIEQPVNVQGGKLSAMIAKK